MSARCWLPFAGRFTVTGSAPVVAMRNIDGTQMSFGWPLVPYAMTSSLPVTAMGWSVVLRSVKSKVAVSPGHSTLPGMLHLSKLAAYAVAFCPFSSPMVAEKPGILAPVTICAEALSSAVKSSPSSRPHRDVVDVI